MTYNQISVSVFRYLIAEMTSMIRTEQNQFLLLKIYQIIGWCKFSHNFKRKLKSFCSVYSEYLKTH
jgi:hypothetical protein